MFSTRGRRSVTGGPPKRLGSRLVGKYHDSAAPARQRLRIKSANSLCVLRKETGSEVKMGDAVVITGGCGDIGLATAAEFARAGQRRLALCDLLDEREAEARLAPVREAGAELLY